MRRGRYFERILEIYPLQRDSRISIADTVEMLTQDVLRDDRFKLQAPRTWEGILQVAKELDEIHLGEVGRTRPATVGTSGKYSEQRPERTKGDRSAGGVDRQNVTKNTISCFICGGEHYANKCTQRKTGKKLGLMIEERSAERPRITLRVDGKTISPLLDTGASSNFISKRQRKNWGVRLRHLKVQ